MKAERSGSECVSVGQLQRGRVSRVSAAPDVDRALKIACVGDRGTERHIGQRGQLEPDMSFSGLKRHASLGLAVGAFKV